MDRLIVTWLTERLLCIFQQHFGRGHDEGLIHQTQHGPLPPGTNILLSCCTVPRRSWKSGFSGSDGTGFKVRRLFAGAKISYRLIMSLKKIPLHYRRSRRFLPWPLSLLFVLLNNGKHHKTSIWRLQNSLCDSVAANVCSSAPASSKMTEMTLLCLSRLFKERAALDAVRRRVQPKLGCYWRFLFYCWVVLVTVSSLYICATLATLQIIIWNVSTSM